MLFHSSLFNNYIGMFRHSQYTVHGYMDRNYMGHSYSLSYTDRFTELIEHMVY